MANKTTKVEPSLKRVLLEIDELAKLGAISEKLRIKASEIAARQSGDWTGMKYSEMVDLAISLARIS